MILYLCEKPSQAKEIAPHVGARQRGDGCFVGNGVTVTWAIGHLLEQAQPDHYNPALKFWNLDHLPVIPKKWKMEIKSKTKAQYQIVSNLVKQASQIVVSTDADREGEVIAREIMQLNDYKGTVSRLWLSAFDDASVKKAVKNLLPGAKTLPMYFSGMGRARADWLAGMNMTMALTKAFGTGGAGGVLHCGRVQTPVLALIVRRERAIANFVPKTHYGLNASFSLAGVEVPMAWQPSASLLDKDGQVIDRAAVEAIARRVAGKTGSVSAIDTTPEREIAPLPYSLGSLQRDASARFGMKAQAVLDAAQALYEKHKATSYPRSDCEHLPSSMIGEAADTIKSVANAVQELAGFAKSALTAVATNGFSGRAFNDKKITAHHAIIPTQKPDVNRAAMTENERIVYDMICRRYLAQFLGDFKFMKTVIQVACENEVFRVTGKMPTVQGWRVLYPQQDSAKKKKDDDAPEELSSLPKVAQGDKTTNIRCEVQTKKTKPPKRYTEGTLLAAMESIDKEIDDPRWKLVMKNKEKAGIGTDATRSSIIEGLFRRDYIVAIKKELAPTERGNALIALIEGIAPELADPVLTAQWEDQLSQIERGELDLVKFEHDLAQWLKSVTDQIKAKAGSVSVGSKTTNGKNQDQPTPCPTCQKQMRRIKGPKGFFWSCSGYPDCKTTLPDNNGVPGKTNAPRTDTSNAVKIASPCPKCGGAVRAHEKMYACDTGDFKLWREIAGRKLSEAEAASLIKNGQLPKMQGFISKLKKPFAAGLQLSDDKSKVEFVF